MERQMADQLQHNQRLEEMQKAINTLTAQLQKSEAEVKALKEKVAKCSCIGGGNN